MKKKKNKRIIGEVVVMTGPVGLGVEVVVCCFFVCVYVNKHFLKIPYSDDG